MFDFGMALRRVIERAHTVTVTAANGTNIRMQIGLPHGRLHRFVAPIQTRLRQTARRAAQRAGLTGIAGRLQKRPPRAFVLDPCGILDTNTRGTFLADSSLFADPRNDRGDGVIDGFLWPPMRSVESTSRWS